MTDNGDDEDDDIIFSRKSYFVIFTHAVDFVLLRSYGTGTRIFDARPSLVVLDQGNRVQPTYVNLVTHSNREANVLKTHITIGFYTHIYLKKKSRV